ncbi:Scr1 family TA system antitoxin-like transcriptional regulator [Nocardia jejuensis]|uniref:Scr1 family TA system antitoxin-like transcriptional regulator n=1 Tax=Nocardia jejuensis TaxID=328049 RepID=UPI00350E3EB7
MVDLERRIELTAKRQARLDDPTFRYEALLCEAVLRNRVGEPGVMGAQLERPHSVDRGLRRRCHRVGFPRARRRRQSI